MTEEAVPDADLDVDHHRAPHAGPEFDSAVERCRSAVLTGVGLDHVAHFDTGHYDFSVTASSGLVPPRVDLLRVGHQLTFTTASLSDSLRPVRTGLLIRLVVQTDDGLAMCCTVQPGEFLVGAAFVDPARVDPTVGLSSVPRVRATDRLLSSDVVGGFREELSLRPENPGGWLAERPDSTEPALVDGSDPAVHHIGGSGPLSATLARSLSIRALQSVLLVQRGRVVAGADVLGDSRLAHYFRSITVSARRAFYLDWSWRLPELAGQLGQVVRPVLRRRPRRIVYDVQRGAIFYYRLDGDSYLQGVTLNQAAVLESDDQMAALAMDLDRLRRPTSVY